MRAIFLSSSAEDVRWFTRYYRVVFPAGSPRGRARLEQSLSLLLDNPYAGREIAHGIRGFPISGTPFPLLYRVAEDRIEIVRLWDGRADRGAIGLFDEGPQPE